MAAPLIVVPSTSVGTGTTLADLVDELADQLGLFAPATITAAPSAGDTTRYVLSDDISDDEARQPYGGHYLYVTDGTQAGTQREMARDGYLGPQSAQRLTRPLPAVLAPNTTVKLTWPLPVKRYLNVKGLNQCIDEALDRMPVQVWLPFVGDGSRSYSLAAYPWLTEIEQTAGLYDFLSEGTSNPATRSPYRYLLVRDGATVTLQPRWTYTTGQAFSLAVLVPASRLIYDGATWAYTTFAARGLRNHDTYATAAEPRWVLAFAMVKALQAVRMVVTADTALGQNEKALQLTDIARRLGQWAKAVRQIVDEEFPLPYEETTPALVWTGAANWSRQTETSTPTWP